MQKISPEQTKTIMFDILVAFDAFCVEHGLNYSLCAGTLLGAIRHRGFIPWDDDVDVMIPRSDFEFVTKHFNKWGKGRNLRFYTYRDKGYYYSFGKICYKKTRLIEDGREGKLGVYIDVMPVDYLKDDTSCERLLDWVHSLSALGTRNYYHRARGSFLTLAKLGMINAWRMLKKPFRKRILIRKIEAFLEANRGDKNACVYDRAVSRLWGRMPDLNILDCETAIFEKKSFRIIKKWDVYLTIHYGDYMTLPPMEKRVPHNNVAYLK